jgi:hypothetical protein
VGAHLERRSKFRVIEGGNNKNPFPFLEHPIRRYLRSQRERERLVWKADNPQDEQDIRLMNNMRNLRQPWRDVYIYARACGLVD